MAKEYKAGNNIWDKTRKKVSKIKRVTKSSAIDTVFALIFEDNSGTQYLDITTMRDLYPCLGSNDKTAKVLFGARR